MRQSDISMMGEAQKGWFKEQLLVGRDDYALTFWLSSVPWISEESQDNWAGYSSERREIADFIKANAIDNLVILSADAHMVAVDDGTNSDYATDGGAPIPVLHAGALNQVGTLKGGPYSHGYFKNPTPEDGQFATIDVADDGGNRICLEFTGKRLPAGETETVDLLAWNRCFVVASAGSKTYLPFIAQQSTQPKESSP